MRGWGEEEENTFTHLQSPTKSALQLENGKKQGKCEFFLGDLGAEVAYKRKSAGLSGQWQGKERTWIVRGASWKGFTAPVRAAAPSCIETEQTDDNNGQTAPSVTAVPQKLTCG